MRILLFSDSRRVFEKTNEIIQSKFELMWYKYDDLQKGQYPLADVVIIHFDKDRIQDATIPIIRIKGRLGTHVSSNNEWNTTGNLFCTESRRI